MDHGRGRMAAAGPGREAQAAGDAAACWRAWTPDDRAALGVWAAAHLALFVLAWAAAWVYRAPDHAPLTGVFEHWDAVQIQNIAQYGYFSPHSLPNDIALFPGYPLTLAAVHLALRNWVLAELVLSGCCGLLCRGFLVPAGGRTAGGALPAHHAGRGFPHGWLCGVLVPGAGDPRLARRSPGPLVARRAAGRAGGAGAPRRRFPDLALAVMALTGPRGARLGNAAKACCALAGPAAYEIYLRVHTGSWEAWAMANQAGWGLHSVTPLQALKTTWWAAFRHPFSAAVRVRAPAGARRDGRDGPGHARVPVAAPLARGRLLRAGRARPRHPDLVPKLPAHLLVLFPVWIALARLEAGRPWVRYTYLGVSAPLAVVVGLLFLTYQWAG